MSCGLLPGKGEAPVAVAAPVGSLTANTVYHFRVVAKTSAGTSRGEDVTLTTLKTSATGETTEPTKPAKAKDEGLSVEASEGTGKVTIGPYGSNIGGPPLAHSEGEYVQVYHSEEASFKKMEYEDCELGGARTIWWENPATGWEAYAGTCRGLRRRSQMHQGHGHRIDHTQHRRPVRPAPRGRPGGERADREIEPAKKGHFEDAVCTKEKYTEKKGVRTYKGKYEWLPAPVECFAMKHGRYAEGTCGKEDFSENKKTHEKKYKGKYEKGANTFDLSGGSVTVKVEGQSSLECLASSAPAGRSALPTRAR